jgi:parallel beta-helix repeat protein
LHRDIRIENNTITDWNHRAIYLRSATGCSIVGNIITSTPGAKFADPNAENTAIVVDNATDCIIANNDLTDEHRLPDPGRRVKITDSDGLKSDMR